jgi:hypothetical protein
LAGNVVGAIANRGELARDVAAVMEEGIPRDAEKWGIDAAAVMQVMQEVETVG